MFCFILLQHLLYFIAHETTPSQQEKLHQYDGCKFQLHVERNV